MGANIMEFFEKILANISAMFRHVVPGCVILAFAWLSHPSWFANFDPGDSKHLWIVGLVSLIVGNVAYVLHRAIIHQLVDFSVSGKWPPKKYPEEVVAKMIEKHVLAVKRRRQLIHLKNAQIILSAIFAEVCFVASFFYEPMSHVAARPCFFRWGGAAIFAGSVFAHWVSQHAERNLADSTLKKEKA